MNYLNARVQADGHLLITADNKARAWLKEHECASDDDLLWEGFEGYWANGRFWPFDAGRADPFVGLWCGPCIAESMDVDDDGKHSINGRCWAYMAYEVRSPINELRNRGRTIFHLI